jgi:indolepyruvate ferredoxin oxidoreductase alpha subunit
MPERNLNGDEAMAYGALVAGVKLVTSYPGSPSSGTVEALIRLAHVYELVIEWSSNEKVAMELAIGTSIAGRRALVCVKSVGMNAMLDPLMVLNITPVHGGLVILLGDDPGGYGSQNDQDTRAVAPLLQIPWLEPDGPAEGFAMMGEAFTASERLQLPIIVRETRSFTRQTEPIDVPEGPYDQPTLGLARERWRFVPVPSNVVEKNRALHARQTDVCRWVAGLPFNQIRGDGPRGIVAAGFAYRKLLDVLGARPPEGIRLLKMGSLYPLPEELAARFLSECREVLVLEENEPYVEDRLKALAHEHELSTKLLGKLTGHVPREGELFRWQIHQALLRFLPGLTPAREYRQADEAAERPLRENHCAGCRYGEILDVLQSVAAESGQELVLVGDPGCLATVAERLDAKYAIGSAVGVANGISRAGIAGRAVALFGDSSFFHTTIPAICNAVANHSDILMIVLDNRATVTSGFQPNPGVGRDALGHPAPELSIERIGQACGVRYVRRVNADDPGLRLREVFREVLAYRGLALLVIRTLCDRPAV